MDDLYCAPCLLDRKWTKANTLNEGMALCYEHLVASAEFADDEANAVLDELEAHRPG